MNNLESSTDGCYNQNISEDTRLLISGNSPKYPIYLSIDDFYKVQGYACFYKSDSLKCDMIKAEDITVTYVCENRPEKLLKYLQKECGKDIIEYEKGIYYIQDLYFPTQLIITSELSTEINFWLRNLTNHLKETNEAKKLLEEYGKHQTETLYQALMEVIVKANYEVFKEDGEMCDALMEIAIEKIQEGTKMPDALMAIAIEKIQEGGKMPDALMEIAIEKIQEGGKMPDALMEIAMEKMKNQLDAKKEEGATEVLLGLVREGILTIQDVAKRLSISEEKVREML